MRAQIESSLLKIRASAAGHLMASGTCITAKQLEKLNELQVRKDGKGKPLTENMENELKELIAKRDAPEELGRGAKSYVEELWLETVYGYKEPVVTDVLLKGNMCEQDGIRLVSEVWPCDEFRVKCKQPFKDDFFTGNPDILLKQVVEDIKSAWSIKTFFNVEAPDPIYYAQGQVYMHLTGRTKFRVHHCLLNTPVELVHNEQKRFFWKYGGDENNRYFQAAAEQIERNHNYWHIPANERVKTFEFDYDPAFITELQGKVKLARVYFDSLKLNNK